VRLAPHLELVPLRLGQMLYEPGVQLQHAYFPTTGIVSLRYVMESRASAENAGVGNEGVVGISLYLGGDTTPSSAVFHTRNGDQERVIDNRRHIRCPARSLIGGRRVSFKCSAAFAQKVRSATPGASVETPF
jgi:hypothetical protein